MKPIKGSAALLIAPLMIPPQLCRGTLGSAEATVAHTHARTLTHAHLQTRARTHTSRFICSIDGSDSRYSPRRALFVSDAPLITGSR